jgi:outer membrane protein, heavy metal efflux system
VHLARNIVALTLPVAIVFATGCASERPRSTVLRLDPRPADEIAAAPRETGSNGPRTRDEVEAPDAPDDSVVATSFHAADVETDDRPSAPHDENASSTGLTLASLESWALRCNPAIQQASASAYKAMGFRDQVGLAPNPTIGFFGEQIGDNGTDQYGAFVSQDFVTAGKLTLNRNVLSHSVQAQLWEVEAQRYRVVTDVRLRFYDSLAAQQRLNAVDSFQLILDQKLKDTILRKEAGEVGTQEAMPIRILVNEYKLVKRRAEIAYQAAWKELAAIVGDPGLKPTSLEIPQPLSLTPREWDSVYHDLVRRSPELKAANARVCRAAANVQRQQSQPVPNLEVQAGVGHDLATDRQFGQLQAEMPIPLFNKNQGNIAAADAEYCRAQQDYRRLQMSLKARLAKAAQDFDSALAAVDLYESQIEGNIDESQPVGIVRQAEINWKLTEELWKAGEPGYGFLEMLYARRTYFDASLELINARRDLSQAGASIDGLLLSGGLNETVDTAEDDGLRGQALSGQ